MSILCHIICDTVDNFTHGNALVFLQVDLFRIPGKGLLLTNVINFIERLSTQGITISTR